MKDRQDDGPPTVEQSPREEEEVERLARRQQSMEAGEIQHPLLSSNWMRRNGWTKLFTGVDRSILVALLKPPAARADGFNAAVSLGKKLCSPRQMSTD